MLAQREVWAESLSSGPAFSSFSAILDRLVLVPENGASNQGQLYLLALLPVSEGRVLVTHNADSGSLISEKPWGSTIFRMARYEFSSACSSRGSFIIGGTMPAKTWWLAKCLDVLTWQSVWVSYLAASGPSRASAVQKNLSTLPGAVPVSKIRSS